MSKRIHPVIGMPLVAFAAVAMLLGACGGGSGSKGTNGTTAARQKQLLRDAAHGTWTGPFGTLEFKTDGTATFTLKECNDDGETPDPALVDTNCAPKTYTGPVSVDDQQYMISAPGGGYDEFDAWVGRDGKLHVGRGTVAFLGPNRAGTAALQFGKFKIDGSQCDQLGDQVARPVVCHFAQKGGQVVFTYTAIFSLDETGKTTSTGELVYLADDGLLVLPQLVSYTFTKQ
ncbi:MAG TPA: hypothetical protein VF441_09025 [Acidimicrobiia bacterium]